MSGDGLRAAVEALAVGALVQWAGEAADLDDCREAGAVVADCLAPFLAEHPATADSAADDTGAGEREYGPDFEGVLAEHYDVHACTDNGCEWMQPNDPKPLYLHHRAHVAEVLREAASREVGNHE